MATGVKIKGGNVKKQSVESVAKGVDRIFESAHKNRMDQETVREALKVLSRVGTVDNTNISGNSIGMGR